MFKSILGLLFFLVFTSFSVVTEELDRPSQQPVQVLLLNSFNQDMPWQQSVESGLRQILDSQAIPFNLFIENLDVGRFDEAEQLALFKYYLLNKYADKKVDVVVTQDAAAAILLRQLPQFHRSVPRVYVEPGAGFKLLAGERGLVLNTTVNYQKASNSAIKLMQPDKVLVIADTNNSISLEAHNALVKVLQLQNSKIQIETLSNLPVQQLVERLETAQRNSIALYTPIFRQVDGIPQTPYQTAIRLAEKSNVPIFTYWYPLMGSGVVGGYLLSGELVGQQTALAIIRHVQGQPFVNVEQSSLSAFHYDWRQLTKFGIDFGRLPENSILEYYKPSFYEQYKSIIFVVFAAFVVLISLLVFVVSLNTRRLNLLNELESERQLLESRVLIRTQDLEKAKNEAENSAKAKSEFLANMSHEIRTPMGGVIGLTNLLKQTPLSDKQRQYLDKIGYSADQLLVVINDILDFSKIESGNIELEAHPFSINTVTDYLTATFDTVAQEKGIDFVVSLDSKLHPDLVGDIVRINQVLINLCSNALKFTHQGQVRVRIYPLEGNVDAPTENYPIVFSVSDTGIGIENDKLNSLFDAFTQADTSTTRKFGGTGLGLSISKRLCQLMQGDIQVDSELGGAQLSPLSCI
ncbi:sensor histidine kinase [Catenovulum sediminis]|uniref:sensor histidine kinase n=1 Tax=Catenovulum sediminis TaxID=1740262 RepID=UPI00117E821C|nr:ATP-binding protein [Catenovulum sediminis]